MHGGMEDSTLSNSGTSRLCVHSGSADEFLYTRQGRSPTIDGVDDSKELSTTRQAFALLGNTRVLSKRARCNPDRQRLSVLMPDFNCFKSWWDVWSPFAGINESAQMGVFQVLAAVLHLGNVEIRDKDSDSSTIAVSIPHKKPALQMC